MHLSSTVLSQHSEQKQYVSGMVRTVHYVNGYTRYLHQTLLTGHVWCEAFCLFSVIFLSLSQIAKTWFSVIKKNNVGRLLHPSPSILPDRNVADTRSLFSSLSFDRIVPASRMRLARVRWIFPRKSHNSVFFIRLIAFRILTREFVAAAPR